jgi:ABC-type amino acid transport substrate-binding protein
VVQVLNVDSLARGRPKKLNPLGENFRCLYLNPLLSYADICRELKISKSTFYVYEKELNVPTLRVGIGNSSGLPSDRALKQFTTALERYDSEVIRALARKMTVRFKLIPLSFQTQETLVAVKEGAVDLGISSISWTKERGDLYYFSEGYIPSHSPNGRLITWKGREFGQTRAKPKLGVVEGSVHASFAKLNLRLEFHLKTYRSMAMAFNALRESHVDAVLTHEDWVNIFGLSQKTEIQSRKYNYNSFTGIIAHHQSALWLPEINRALEQLQDERFLERTFANMFRSC